jgi:hypothetical protein
MRNALVGYRLLVHSAAARAQAILHDRMPSTVCKCGYYLGNRSDRCPECGESVERHSDKPGDGDETTQRAAKTEARAEERDGG